mgnify:CR=1 FL=1
MAQQYFVLGIGGTGMRCIESLIHLCAMGMFDDTDIHLLALDTDKDNGNFARLKEVKEAYVKAKGTDASLRTALNENFLLGQENGGEYTMSMAYLLSWQGPVLESQDPYGDKETVKGLKAAKHVQEIQILPERDFQAIKRAVYENGGVQSSLYTSLKDAKKAVLSIITKQTAPTIIAAMPTLITMQ